MNIHLILPQSELEVFGSNFEQDYATMAGHGHIRAQLMDRGHNVKSLDCIAGKVSFKESLDYIKKFNPTLIVISCILTPEDSIKYSNFLIHSGVKARIVTFGEAALNHRYILENAPGIDFVVMGEPENTLLDIVDYFECKVAIEDIRGVSYLKNGTLVENKPRSVIENLDDIGFPYFDPEKLDSSKRYYILSSKGCNGTCTFCRTQAYNSLTPGKKWRPKSPEKVVDEMEMIYNKHGISVFSFYDQEFMGGGIAEGRHRAHCIADEILKRKLRVQFSFLCRADDVEYDLFRHLKNAGLNVVFIGIESGSQDVLNRLKKGTTVEVNEKAIEVLKSLKISYQPGWLMYTPRATLKEIEQNLRFIRKTGLYKSIWFYVTIFNDLRTYYKTPLFMEFARRDSKDISKLYDIFEYPLDYSEVYMNVLLKGLSDFHHLIKKYMALLSFCLKQSSKIVKQQIDLLAWIDYINKISGFEQNLGLFVLESFEKAMSIICSHSDEGSLCTEPSFMLNVAEEIDREVVKDFYEYAHKHFNKHAKEFFMELSEFLISATIINRDEYLSFAENLSSNI